MYDISLSYSWFKAGVTLLIIWPISTWLTNLMAHKYLTHNIRLPDLIHISTERWWKSWRYLSRIKDIVVYLPTFYAIIVLNLFYPYLFDDFTNFMCGIICIRCLFFSVTILPTSSDNAHTKGKIERFFFGGCHDLIFSGHVAYYYAALLFLQYHGLLFRSSLFSLFSTILLSLISIITRDHYTIDILVVFPVVWMWKEYMLTEFN